MCVCVCVCIFTPYLLGPAAVSSSRVTSIHLSTLVPVELNGVDVGQRDWFSNDCVGICSACLCLFVCGGCSSLNLHAKHTVDVPQNTFAAGRDTSNRFPVCSVGGDDFLVIHARDDFAALHGTTPYTHSTPGTPINVPWLGGLQTGRGAAVVSFKTFNYQVSFI